MLPFIPKDRQSTESEMLKVYGRDWTKYVEPKPSQVVFPKTTSEVQQLVQWARKNKVALVPSGGRTGLSGGAVAFNNEVVVSFEKMNQIVEFDKTGAQVTVQAGMVTESLQQLAKEKGLYFPVDFASRGSSQIGGNVATNAGGIKVLRYGLIRNWISGLQVVTGTGEILELNRGLVKNATGYDLRQLFIGSEGTLGFITEVTVKLTQSPPPLKVFVMGVKDLVNVMKVYQKFRDETSLVAFELFTDKALKTVLHHAKDLQEPFATPCPVYLLVEVESADESHFEKTLEVFESCLEDELILDGVVSQNETQSRVFWRLREDISEACAPFTPYKNDVSVRISAVPEFIKEVDQVLKKHYPDLTVVWFGHIGDGNLHINILKPTALSMSEFVEKCRKIDSTLYTVIQKMGGSISAEHGVGLTKKPFLNYTRSDAEIQIMKQIKNVFDPDRIMNPGKIFD